MRANVNVILLPPQTLLDGECARARVGVTTTGKPENGGLSALHYAACSDTDFVSGKLEVNTVARRSL